MMKEVIDYKNDPSTENLEKAVIKHLRLVYYVIKRLNLGGSMYEELVQSGSVGLIQALKGFNPAVGTQFSTYAMKCIISQIYRYLRENNNIIRIPAKMAILLEKELRGDLDSSSLTKSERNRLERARNARQPINMDFTVSNSLTVDDPADKVIADVEVTRLLKVLTEKEKTITTMYWIDGLNSTEIAKQIGVTPITVVKILKRSINKMRKEAGFTEPLSSSPLGH